MLCCVIESTTSSPVECKSKEQLKESRIVKLASSYLETRRPLNGDANACVVGWSILRLTRADTIIARQVTLRTTQYFLITISKVESHL
jgi:hypothetical protein